MSSVICAMAAAWSSVSGNGSAAWNAGTSGPSTACTMPVASAASARLRATRASCIRRNSSNLRRCAAAERSVMVSGRWMPRYALPRSISWCLGAEVAGERIGEAPRLRALQARRHRPAQLPGVHLGLPRLRVHGHDGARDVGVGVGIGEHVDDRVRHLALAPVALDLAEERHLRARAQLAFTPRLVEEHDLEETGAVVHGRVHDRALAVARAASVDGPHLGIDRRLLADLEVVDLGPLGAVDVAARVVLQEVEHRLDAHLGETGAQLVADRLQLGDAVRRELAQREARGHHRSRATRRR